MALIKSVRGFTPKIGENCYLADNATIIGDVVIGKAAFGLTPYYAAMLMLSA